MFPLSFLHKLTGLACIGGFLFGYDTGVISGALILLQETFNLSDTDQEIVVSATVGAAMVGALLSGSIVDMLGRKIVVLISSALYCVGALVMSMAPNFIILIIGRLIVGLGVGVSSMCIPIYLSEVAPPETRGTIVTCLNLAITFGQFFASIVNGGFSSIHQGWRYSLGLAALPAAIQLFGLWSFPESPRWLVQHGKLNEAKNALAALRHPYTSHNLVTVVGSDREKLLSDSPSAPTAASEYNEIYDSIQEEKNIPSVRFRDIFSQLSYKRALSIGCSLQAVQQICGINTIMYYSATILKIAGFASNSMAIWLSVVTSFTNFFGTVIGLYFVDKAGRRSLTLISLFFSCICLGIISAFFYIAQVKSSQSAIYDNSGHLSTCNQYRYCFDCAKDDNCGYCQHIDQYGSGCVAGNDDGPKNLSSSVYQCDKADFDYGSCSSSSWTGYLILVGLILFLLCFAPGMGPMPWTVNAEIYPLRIRGYGNSLSTATNWGCNLLVSMTFLTLAGQITQYGAFALYGSVSFCFFIFLYFRMPETAGKSLEDIQLMLEKDDVSATPNDDSKDLSR